MKLPRFTLRFLLVVVTVAAVGLGIGGPLFIERSVTQAQCLSVEPGMSGWQVRWILGPPHRRQITASTEAWGYDYADSEELPLSYFDVRFDKPGGSVAKTKQGEYFSGAVLSE